MKINNLIESLTIELSSSIRDAMVVVNKNSHGICFVINEKRILKGVLTDGDIRRALLKNSNIESPVKKIMNTAYIALNIKSPESLIRKTFKKSLRYIPLIDDNGILVDIADAQRNHKIPILEPSLQGNELKYIQNCIETNWISSQGEYVGKFENIFENKHKNMTAISVSNGTVALHLALMSLGIGKGDEVIVPSITFAATINAVLHCGAKPVICEINPNTWCIEPREFEKLISLKTKAVIPVHLYGQVCEMKEIINLSRRKKLFVIEDCAEAIGSEYDGKPVGLESDASTFSFFGNKTISTGEGGMVLFKDQQTAKIARLLRDHGMSNSKKYWHEIVGYNYRMTNLQAAIGVAQMERLEKIVRKKEKIAQIYRQLLIEIKDIYKLPLVKKNVRHSNWLFTIILREGFNRDLIISKLKNYGIDCRPVFYPLNDMPPYHKYRRSKNLDNTYKISYNGISLPSSVNLTKDEISYIVKKLKDVLAECSPNFH